MTQNNTVIALAIVVAGALIAGSLYFANNSSGTPTPGNNNETAEISVAPLGADDYVLGNPDADIALIEYSDLECPFCKRFHGTMKQVIEEHDVAWVYRHFPLTQIHPNAPALANAAECAGEVGGNQAFWDYVDGIFEQAPEGEFFPVDEIKTLASQVGAGGAEFNACVDENRYEEDVASDFQEAVDNGGRGTPFTVMVLDEEMSNKAVEAVLAVNDQLGQQLIFVSEDGTQVSMSGALSADIVGQVIEATQQ